VTHFVYQFEIERESARRAAQDKKKPRARRDEKPHWKNLL